MLSAPPPATTIMGTEADSFLGMTSLRKQRAFAAGRRGGRCLILLAPGKLNDSFPAVNPHQRLSLFHPNQTMFIRKLAALLGVAVFLSACTPPAEETLLSGMTQGTTYHIKFVAPPKTDLPAVKGEIENAFAAIDAGLSNYREDSEISRLNQQKTTEWLDVAPEIVRLVAIAKFVHGKSAGCYDLTVKPLLQAWGFFKHEGVVPADEQLAEILTYVGMDKIELDAERNRLRKLDPRVEIDLSSIAQGHTIGVVAGLLEQRGIHDYLAEIGGEMKVKGRKANGQPWRVAIEKPVPDMRAVQRIVAVPPERPLAIMTSGGYRNFFESGGKTYSHIINPKTGKPVEHHLLAVSVIHADPTWADAWSTALQCLGDKDGPAVAERENLEALFITGEGETLSLHETLSPRLAADPLL
jgi:thiamine biosynthesis lipoprotein